MLNWMRRLVSLFVGPTLPRYSGPLASRAGGMLVNTETALAYATVWGCVNAITGAILTAHWSNGEKHLRNQTPANWRSDRLPKASGHR